MSVDERRAANDSWSQELEIRKQWREGLIRNRERLSDELGRNAEIPVAFVKKYDDGVVELNVTMAQAEQILHAEELALSGSNLEQTEWYRNLATLAHEYVHTQGTASVDGGLDFGIALEERRAEYFSGDKQGYGEIKDMVKALKVITGIDVLKMFDELEHHGRDATELYTALTNQMDLNSTLELLMALPPSYVDGGAISEFGVSANRHFGSFEGLLMNQYQRMIAEGREGEMMKRIEETADRMSNNFSYEVLSSVRALWRNRGMGEAADVIWNQAARNAAEKQGLENLEWFDEQDGDLGLEAFWRTKEKQNPAERIPDLEN